MPVVTIKPHEVDTEYLPPIACEAHACTGAVRAATGVLEAQNRGAIHAHIGVLFA
jgi:hypothetical protein